MSSRIYLPSVADIGAVFTEECTALGATAIDTYEDDRRLFQRAVVTPAEEVRPGDRIRGGIALRTVGSAVDVHPYTWRQVCTNGAIRATATDTVRVERIEVETMSASAMFVGGFVAELRRAIQTCADPRYLVQSRDAMRTAAEMEAETMLSLLPHLLRMPGVDREQLVAMVLGRYEEDTERSAYSVVNAVTSVARDTTDPALRWRLEQAGGRLLDRARARASGSGAPAQVLASA
jgi:hypothetical protein